MRRWAFQLVAAVSFLLCLGMMALWVRSYHDTFGFSWGDPVSDVGHAVGVSQGDLVFRSSWSARPIALNANTRAMQVTLSRSSAPGFTRERTSWLPETVGGRRLAGSFGTDQETRVSLAWALVPLLATTAWLLILWNPRPRFPRGRCQRCGYDLRATPERCPECGTVPAAKVKA